MTNGNVNAALAPVQAAGLLAATQIVLQAEMAALSPSLLRWQPAPEEWCVLEIIGHLIETEERGFAGRIRTILAEPRPMFRGWDPDAVAHARADRERDGESILAEFSARRAASVALVETLTDSDLDRGGDHPDVGFLTVRDLLHEWMFHDGSHLNQLRAIVQAYAWPHMGNARRFSDPEIEAIGPPG